MHHPLAEDLRETARQLKGRAALLMVAADALDHVHAENTRLHGRIDELVDEWERDRRLREEP